LSAERPEPAGESACPDARREKPVSGASRADRAALARLVGTGLLALGLTLALFTNRMKLLAVLASVALYWLPALAILGFVSYRSRKAAWAGALVRRQVSCALVLFLAAAAVACIFASDGRRFARHVVEFLVVWLPVLIAAHWRTLLQRWRDLVAAVVSSSVVVLFVWAAGPYIMRYWILPYYALDLDHRPRPYTHGGNEDGVYTSRPASAFTREGFNIICLGDSFTANRHLEPEDRWPDRLETLLRRRCAGSEIRVANFGWISSSPVLEARRLREIGARYHPALVVQAVDMSDFHDDLRATARIRALKLEGGGGQVTLAQAMGVAMSRLLGTEDYGEWLRARAAAAGPRPARPEIPARRYFPLFQRLSVSEPYLETTWAAILETERLAHALGARFALLVLPRYQQYNRSEAPRDREKSAFPASDEFVLEPIRFFEERRRVAAFPIHSVREEFLHAGVFPTCREDDPHWNAAGNRVTAEAVARLLDADGLLPCAAKENVGIRGSSHEAGNRKNGR
jgi:hypothetical protein